MVSGTPSGLGSLLSAQEKDPRQGRAGGNVQDLFLPLTNYSIWKSLPHLENNNCTNAYLTKLLLTIKWDNSGESMIQIEVVLIMKAVRLKVN